MIASFGLVRREHFLSVLSFLFLLFVPPRPMIRNEAVG